MPELVDVPFFPQTDFDCGPAALATILNAAGVEVTPAELIDQVYIEGLEGSLQAELTAATRRHGLLPVPVGPDPESLLAEIAAGRPVLVLQNLRFARVPSWHYAVVVGYSAERNRFVLRSGEEARRAERESRFLRSWGLADNWGFVAAPPGEIPVTATPDSYMRAVLGASAQLDAEAADRAYSAALARWPADALVLFLSAVREHDSGNLGAATELYRRTLAVDPEQAAARNNLASALLEQGCRDEAAREAAIALRSQAPDGDFYAAIAETIREIQAAPAAAGAVCA